MKRLDYIESTGTQYILTDTNVTKDTYFEIDLTVTSTSSQRVLGNNSPYLYLMINYAATKSLDFRQNGTAYSDRQQIELNTRYSIKYRDNKLYKNNTLLRTLPQPTTTKTGKMYLFCYGGSGSSPSTISNGLRIHSCKIYNLDTLVNYFVPVEDDNGVACLFDLMSDTYYYNQGTGTFTKGPTIPQYTEIEYLESTGTQYIDTGIQAKPTLKLDFGFQMTNLTTLQRIIARTINDSSVTGLNFTFYITSLNQWGYLCENNSTGSYTHTGISVDKNYHKVIFDANESYFDFDNGTYHAAITTTKTNIDTKTLYIFAGNYNNSSIQRYSKMKLYYCKIYDNNELVRDFIPVLDKDNVPCLYDLVSKTYFYNQGTGNFIGGEIMPRTFLDYSGLYTLKSNLDNELATKQGTLTAGNDITIAQDGTIAVDTVAITDAEIDACFE